MRKSALMSDCGAYRYELRRTWDNTKPIVLWVALNPSTADHVKDDPTNRRIADFSRRWGYGGYVLANLFAYRAIDPQALADIREALRGAEGNLARGNESAASNDQERATQGLSELNRNLAAMLDEMQRERTNQGQATNDPFGRQTGGMGNSGENVRVPEEAERQRAKDILEELRRRYNESDDEEEREYLRRLLDRF